MKSTNATGIVFLKRYIVLPSLYKAISELFTCYRYKKVRAQQSGVVGEQKIGGGWG